MDALFFVFKRKRHSARLLAKVNRVGPEPQPHLVEAQEVLDGGRCVEDHPVSHHG